MALGLKKTGVITLAVVGCLAGCVNKVDPAPQGGGQSGHDSEGGDCVEKKTVLGSTSAQSGMSFTADDVLRYSKGSFAAPLHWLAVEDADYGPESGEGEIHLAVAYDGGEVRFVESTQKEDGSEAALVGDCKNRLEVDVVVTLSTAGGALDESFPATLRAIDPRYATLSKSIPPGAIDGSFTVSPKGDYVAKNVSIDAGFTRVGMYGVIRGTLETTQGTGPDAAIGVAGPEFARWPSASTCDGSVVVPLDAALFGFSANDALGRTSAGITAPMTWKNGTKSEVTLDLTSAADIACAELGDYGQDYLTLGAKLRARSSDGRIDGTLDVVVQANSGSDGSLASMDAFIQAAYLSGVAPEQFQSTYGVSGVDLSGYDEGSLDLTTTFSPSTGNALATTGRIAVLGLTIPDCVENPPPADENSAPGCRGVDFTEIDWAEW